MDRRHSTARNELSVSLNRMALSGRALSTGLGTGGAGATAAAIDALMHEHGDPAHHVGHGELERETSFMLDEHRESRSSDVCISRLSSMSFESLP
jgi:hypothetical protein